MLNIITLFHNNKKKSFRKIKQRIEKITFLTPSFYSKNFNKCKTRTEVKWSSTYSERLKMLLNTCGRQWSSCNIGFCFTRRCLHIISRDTSYLKQTNPGGFLNNMMDGWVLFLVLSPLPPYAQQHFILHVIQWTPTRR